MDGFAAFDIAASGMAAQRTQMDLIAENLANASTERTAEGGPYRPKFAVFEAAPASDAGPEEADYSDMLVSLDEDTPQAQGVRLASIEERTDDAQFRYDPNNPLAAQRGPHKGYVALPDIDPVQQMVALISTGRTYDADVSALQAAKLMQTEAIEIDR